MELFSSNKLNKNVIKATGNTLIVANHTQDGYVDILKVRQSRGRSTN